MSIFYVACYCLCDMVARLREYRWKQLCCLVVVQWYILYAMNKPRKQNTQKLALQLGYLWLAVQTLRFSSSWWQKHKPKMTQQKSLHHITTTLPIWLTATIKDVRLLCKQLCRSETDAHSCTEPEWYDWSILLVSFTQELMQTSTRNDVRYVPMSATVMVDNDSSLQPVSIKTELLHIQQSTLHRAGLVQ